MKHKICLLSAVTLLAISYSPLSMAKVGAQITCREFIQMDDITQPKIVYWMDGFDRAGNVESDSIDIAGNDRLVPILVQECTKNPNHLLAKKIKAAHKTAKL